MTMTRSLRQQPTPVAEADQPRMHLVAAILGWLAAHERRLAALERPRLEADARLHGALVERIGFGPVFSAAEIIRFAREDAPLYRVLEGSGLLTPNRLGRRLLRGLDRAGTGPQGDPDDHRGRPRASAAGQGDL